MKKEPGLSMAMPAEEEKEKEKVDLDALFSEVDWARADPVALERGLEVELIELEKESLKNLAELGQKAANVVTLLNTAKNELGMAEDWLDLYSLQLSTMRQEMGQIEEINQTLQLQSKNQKLLLATLDLLLPAIELPSAHLRKLREGNFAVASTIVEMEEAVRKLQAVLSHKLDESLSALAAVKERLEFYSRTAALFAARFLDYMKGWMEERAEALRADNSKQARKGTLKLIPHDPFYASLESFRGLTLLLKDLDPRQHLELQMIYQHIVNGLYQNEILELIECLKSYHLLKKSEEESPMIAAATSPSSGLYHVFSSPIKLTMSSSSAAAKSKSLPSRQSEYGKPLETRAMELNLDQKLSLEQCLEIILSLFIPTLLKEKQFCSSFYYGRSEASPPSQANEVKVQRRLKALVQGCFEGFIEALNAFMDSSGRLDLIGCIDLLAGIEATLETEPSEADFLTACLASFSAKLNSVFQKFLEEQCQIIKDNPLSVKKRVGVVPSVASFPAFVQGLEKVTQAAQPESPSKQIVQLSYERLIKLIFEQFEGAEEDLDLEVEKDKLNLCVLNIENHHHLFTQLRGLRVPILDAYLKESKRRYEKYLRWYARMSVQQALGKMIEFFDGIQNLLKTTPAEEINFHLSYNRANTKRIIGQYPLREVKKSLDLVYRRVVKHFCPEEGLQQVVWHTIQDELIARYHTFVSLLQQCYPNSDVLLLFTVQDILDYFSEIAKTNP